MTKQCIAGLALALLLPVSAAVADSWNTNENNIVLDGQDVVAYRLQDRAMRGSAEFSAEYGGATFHFASQDNLEAFRQDPALYAPKFGGFCAFGLATQESKAPVNPETFKIYNGELLLFFNDLHEGTPINTKILWNQNERELYDYAAKTWSTLD